MRVTILLLPTLLVACFVLALSTEVSAPDAPTRLSNPAAEIRELHELIHNASGRLAILEPQSHNFLPRGASASDYPVRPMGTSCAPSAVTVCLVDGRVTTIALRKKGNHA